MINRFIEFTAYPLGITKRFDLNDHFLSGGLEGVVLSWLEGLALDNSYKLNGTWKAVVSEEDKESYRKYRSVQIYLMNNPASKP